mmetsp:Transcript_6714/g.10793  ORF Transcript_6714/g.10793 Transcript_6714/m.10793 type:complete len:132 (+) Transcript_6714:2749-3144(+)
MELEDKHSDLVRRQDKIMRMRFEKNTLMDKLNDLEKKLTTQKSATKRFQEEVKRLSDIKEEMEAEKGDKDRLIEEMRYDLDRARQREARKQQIKRDDAEAQTDMTGEQITELDEKIMKLEKEVEEKQLALN